MDGRQGRLRALRDYELRHLRQLRGIAPRAKGARLIPPNEQVPGRLRVAGLEGAQGVNGVAGTGTHELALVDHRARQAFEGQARHGQAMVARATRT